ncbi:hypothetical protein [uncultured Stenotrophomonas sp.]|uniref:hypothetical protein n=1 Tax=uncultured Stenotrophomonas sp. TaxID=165438 RepID=UPI0028E458C1|nr:hypothetical protein [uncultured Stenotrophomonas sp.]
MSRKRSGRPWQIGVILLIAGIAKIFNAPRSVDHVEHIDVHFISAAPQSGEEHFSILPDGEGFAMRQTYPDKGTPSAVKPFAKHEIRQLVEALEDGSGSQLIVSDAIYSRVDPYELRKAMVSRPAGSPCSSEQWQAGAAAELDRSAAGRTLYRMTAYGVDPARPSPWLEVQLHETGKPTQVWWSVSPKPLMQPWTTGMAAGIVDPRLRTIAAPRWSLGASDALRTMLPEGSLTARQLGLGSAFDDVRQQITENVSARCSSTRLST